MVLTSCYDVVKYNDDYTQANKIANTGAPEISAVYAIGDTACATPIQTAQLGQMIHLVGKNLNNVKSIHFSTAQPAFDADVDLDGIYTASTYANIIVPTELGQKATSMTYTTDMGSITYAITIPFPDLTVNDEGYTWDKDTLIIYGQYFNRYQFGTSEYSKAYIDGNEAEIYSASETELKVKVSESATASSKVKLAWYDGDGVAQEVEKTVCPVTEAATTTGLLYGDFSGTQISPSGITVNVESVDIQDAQSLGRPYLHLTGSLAQWSWNTVDFGQNMPFAIEGSYMDYMLAFELLTPEVSPIPDGYDPFFQFQMNWNSMMAWYPGNKLGLNTHGRWMTITLPLDEIGQDLSAKDAWQAIRVVVKPDYEYAADFYMANFRIVKK